MATDTLTPKQEKYVQGLFKGLSQREAYKQAYNCPNMKDKGIDEKACVLAATVKIKARLKELRDENTVASAITREWVLDSLKAIANKCMSDDTFQPQGANKSIELIGKHLGMFTDKVELAGKDGNELSIKITKA